MPAKRLPMRKIREVLRLSWGLGQRTRQVAASLEWAARRSIRMRQDHKAGERMFVDYAGGTVGVVDRETDSARQAQVFVAVLGASNCTYRRLCRPGSAGLRTRPRSRAPFKSSSAGSEHDPQRVEVRPAVQFQPPGLFRAHVMRRPDRHPRPGQPGRAPDGLGDPEVHEYGCAVLPEHDVLRLDVPVNESLGMRVVQGIGEARQDPQRFSGLKRPGPEQIPQTVGQILHDDEVGFSRSADIVDGNDVWMAEPPRGLGFLQEAVGEQRIAEKSRDKDFDRHMAIEGLLNAQVHIRRSAGPQLSLDGITRDYRQCFHGRHHTLHKARTISAHDFWERKTGAFPLGTSLRFPGAFRLRAKTSPGVRGRYPGHFATPGASLDAAGPRSKCAREAKTEIVVPVGRIVVVAIRSADVLGIVVPGAAAYDPVRASRDISRC